MVELFLIVVGFFLGVLMFPYLLFLRARRDSAWDNSNMANIFRVIAHLATHPGDFAMFQYPDGKKPFPYLGGDEFSDNFNTRPNKEA